MSISSARPGAAAERPLVVQSDGTVLLETASPWAGAAREAIAAFAHLERSPEYIQTYRLTPLSLWNAAASGIGVAEVADALDSWSRYPVPDLVRRRIRDEMGRYGRVRLVPHDGDRLLLAIEEPAIREEIGRSDEFSGFDLVRTARGFFVPVRHRGTLKQALVRIRYPAQDECGYVEGQPLSFSLRETTRRGLPFVLRPYQIEAASAFHRGGGPQGGAGVVALPCGAGKTVVGLAVMAQLQSATLILTTSTVAVHQWGDEILDKTDLEPGDIGEYTGEAKEVRPVTITTYQMLTHRASRLAEFAHLELLGRGPWGLVIYDEVHLLPAPVFRATAEIQVRRRLGLTATLVREDGREDDVFALIGPRIYDAPWRSIEDQGYIAEASCVEVRVGLDEARRIEYALAPKRQRFRIAAENPRKIAIVEDLIGTHADDSILVIGQFLDQLRAIASDLSLPLITGETPNDERERLYDAFRRGVHRVLVVSKVANFAVDLPDASLAIQVSGTFGSRQEEAQRLGRILRPKSRRSLFYTLVSRDTSEEEFAARRQLFLVEQGYRYRLRVEGDRPFEASR